MVPLGMVNPWSVVSSSALCGKPEKATKYRSLYFGKGTVNCLHDRCDYTLSHLENDRDVTLRIKG